MNQAKASNVLKTSEKHSAGVNPQSVRSLASNIFAQLQNEGCRPKDIISVSSQLLSLVTSELKKSSSAS